MTRKLAVGALVLILVPLASADETKKKVYLGPALNEAQCLVAKAKIDALGLMFAELDTPEDDWSADRLCKWAKKALYIHNETTTAYRVWYRGCIRKVEPKRPADRWLYEIIAEICQ